MFGRTRREDTRTESDEQVAQDGRGTDRGGYDDRSDTRNGDRVDEGAGYRDRRTDPAAAQEARRERFGGMNFGAAFFGWLVAVAVSVLLTAIIGAVATAVGVNTQITQSQASAQAGTIGLVAAIVLLVVLFIGYYSGGYVAGRMSRFSGSKQGVGVWLVGLVVTVIAVVLGVVFGQQYNVLGRVNLPRLPVSSSSLSTGAIIAAVVVLLATLLAAVLGGSVGTHYHRRVDRAGWDA